MLRQTGGVTTRYWYSLNGHGDVVALTDTTGNVVDRYHYDTWGVPTIDQETVQQPLLYAGYWYDRELHGPGAETTGWYWLTSRPYDPVLRRFLQPDPSGQDGVRSYVYAGDDPLDLMDPSGLVDCNTFLIGYWCSKNVHARDVAAGVYIASLHHWRTLMARLGILSTRVGMQGQVDSGYIRVGRWMKKEEYKQMLATQEVQDELPRVAPPGQTYVGTTPSPTDFLGSENNDVYVEFDVDSRYAIRAGTDRWGMIIQNNASDYMKARLFKATGYRPPPERLQVVNGRLLAIKVNGRILVEPAGAEPGDVGGGGGEEEPLPAE